MLYCVRLASKRALYKDFTRSTTFLNSWMLATAFHQLSGREILAFLTQRYLDNKVKFDNDWEKRLIILFVNWLNAQNCKDGVRESSSRMEPNLMYHIIFFVKIIATF